MEMFNLTLRFIASILYAISVRVANKKNYLLAIHLVLSANFLVLVTL